ncbi:HAD family hydrolase, partial [Streptomyces sp. SID10362]
EWEIRLPAALAEAKRAAEAAGRTAIAVAWDGEARAVLEVADAVKETSAEAVRRLRALGLTPILLTGDNRAVAESVAAEVGIDEV